MQFSLFCAIILFGGWVLIHGMGGLSMWIDEAWSLEFASPDTIGGVIQKAAIEDVHPPLPYILYHLLHPLFGEHPFGLRVIGWFATLLSAAIVVQMGRELHSWRMGIIGGLLLMTYPLVVGHTFLIRHYTLLMFFATLASWAYWRYSRKWDWRWGVLYWVSGALLLYTMYWGAFVLIAHGIHTLLYRRCGLLWMVLSAGMMGLFLAPWIPSFITQIQSSVLGESGYHSALPINEEGMGIIRYNLFGKSELLIMILALGGIFGSFMPKRARELLPSDQTGFLALIAIMPIFAPIMSDAVFDFGLLAHRPMLVCVPAIVLLIGHVLSSFKAWQYGLLTVALVFNHLMPTIIPATPERGPWWEITAFLSQHVSPSDTMFYASEDDLFFFTLEQHGYLADLPYRAFEYYEFDFAELDRKTERVMWRIQFFEADGLSPQLLKPAGYAPVTPILDFGFFSTDNIRITGFARPDDSAPLYTFGDQLGLMSVEHRQVDNHLQVYLMWKALNTLPNDYTITTFLLKDGVLMAQHDGYPLNGLNPTTLWQPNSWQYDTHGIPLDNLPAGEYQLGIGVYTWWDVKNLPILPCGGDVCNTVILGTVTIHQ
jgi:hypothetical protein